MKHIKLIAAAALVLAAAPAFAADWVYNATTPNGAVIYYDSDTILRSRNKVTVWERYDFTSDKTTKKSETRARYQYDCAERTSTLLQLSNYYPDGKNESFIWNTSEQEERGVIPDSFSEKMLEAVCAATAR
jgi:hypothetical protein